MSVVALAVGVFCAALGHVLLRRFFQRRAWVGIALALASFATGQLGYYVALLGLDVGVVYMANGLIPATALALAHALLGEEVRRQQITAVAVIAVGVAVYAL